MTDSTLALTSSDEPWEEIALGSPRLTESKKGNIIKELIRTYLFLIYLNEKILLKHIVYILYILQS